MKEQARFWRHPAVPETDLLKARYVTHRFSRHAHDGYAIGLIVSGVEEFDYRGTLHRAAAGELVLVNPDAVHTGQAGVPGGWAYRMLYPSIEAVRGIAAELGAAGGTPYFPRQVVRDEQVAALLARAHEAAERGDALAASSLSRMLFARLVTRHATPRPATVPPAEGRRTVRAALELLHESLVDPPALEDLAAAVGARPFALLRAFKAATGLPPHAYLTSLRVRQARRLLQAGVRPARVAAEVGFTDQAHLNRHFKRIVGVPPAAYQRAAGTYKTGDSPGA
ncbi:AraC family transcriptional regulator [Nonomuraea gerenzanensis]|uniref:Transcriptional regulator, AraC family n=1 Tax=Nonomuraea gerenzanensis TaxID=93944 RepID=A0A1M4E762_9ACTN|nr:AraC family transcriptional regulator [Nonomuraea gerenzanensis]UBU16928.1 AraC family transcriptional regulator [Nonomuraea gerenzanensis]SBO94646.1 Transcriptional regulator, AraC family [Nonomuraea gerenzanensis]